MRGKKGQETFGMSVGMIFSILLIIFFISFAIWGLLKIYGIFNNMNTTSLADEIQKEIDGAWSSDGITTEFKRQNIQKEVRFVCFAEPTSLPKGAYSQLLMEFRNPNHNLFLYPSKELPNPSFSIKHLDMNKTLEIENPLCFEVKNQAISFYIVKDSFGNGLVRIEK